MLTFPTPPQTPCISTHQALLPLTVTLCAMGDKGRALQRWQQRGKMWALCSLCTCEGWLSQRGGAQGRAISRGPPSRHPGIQLRWHRPTSTHRSAAAVVEHARGAAGAQPQGVAPLAARGHQLGAFAAPADSNMRQESSAQCLRLQQTEGPPLQGQCVRAKTTCGCRKELLPTVWPLACSNFVTTWRSLPPRQHPLTCPGDPCRQAQNHPTQGFGLGRRPGSAGRCPGRGHTRHTAGPCTVRNGSRQQPSDVPVAGQQLRGTGGGFISANPASLSFGRRAWRQKARQSTAAADRAAGALAHRLACPIHQPVPRGTLGAVAILVARQAATRNKMLLALRGDEMASVEALPFMQAGVQAGSSKHASACKPHCTPQPARPYRSADALPVAIHRE